MNGRSGSGLVMKIYIGIFFLYLYLPLVVMGAATFNSSRFPTVTPWLGTTLKWFPALYEDDRMWGALRNSVLVGIAVIVVSIPLGLILILLTIAAAMIYEVLRRREARKTAAARALEETEAPMRALALARASDAVRTEILIIPQEQAQES